MSTFLLDVNVLLALSLPNHQHHRSATEWFATSPAWATTALTETGYLRLMTNPRVVGYDIAPGQVVDALRAMRSLPGHSFLDDTTSLAKAAIDISLLSGTKQVTDFHLVNLAATQSALLATFDGSLARALSPADRHHVYVVAG